MRIDVDRRSGQFWLTGSQQFQVMKGVSESLAGRIAVLRLAGFSHAVLFARPDLPPFFPSSQTLEARQGMPALDLATLHQLILKGSLPGLHGPDAPDRDLYVSSNVQTYLQRDIRDLAKVGNELAFTRFLRAAAARTGQLLNVADLARDTEVTQVTAKHWLSILESSGQVFLLQPWHSNLTKRLVKTPKLYFLDTGLATWLTAWSTPDTLESGAMSGAILETWVGSELVKGWWHAGKEAPLFFYRDKDMKEIDILVHADGSLHPLEIKNCANPGSDTLRNFNLIEGMGARRGSGAVLCFAQTWLLAGGDEFIVGVGMI